MRALLFLICVMLSAQDAQLQKEIAMGRALAAEVRRTTVPVESQAIQDYVAQLGTRIAAQFPDRGIPYTFSVVQGWAGRLSEPMVLPGAYIFVPLDLFASANDEAEFAGMLTQAAARSTLLLSDQPRSGPAIFFSAAQLPIMLPVGLARQIAATEQKADAAALPAMVRAGFDPSALLRYVERRDPTKSAERIAAMPASLARSPRDTFHNQRRLHRPAGAGTRRTVSGHPANAQPSVEFSRA